MTKTFKTGESAARQISAGELMIEAEGSRVGFTRAGHLKAGYLHR